MNRLEAWGRYGKIWYPDDIDKLRSQIPELANVSDKQIQDMYTHWSEEYFCASWLILFPDTPEEFREWLLGEYKEED